jgi:ubiquinone/menaquinone biosynthesis C-methylase UbiE
MPTATQPNQAAVPDFEAIKRRQQATWASGDFSVVAARIVLMAEDLCEAADVQAGTRVLDVATGSGNAALAAARRGCKVVGLDYVPALLERGRLRADAEHLSVEFVEGDAENLPFADRTFDTVLSIFGAMFAPNHRKTASELARVCKRGGKIALGCWTPTGFIGEVFRATSKYIPPTPGITPPVEWGKESHLRDIFENAAAKMETRVRTAVMRFLSPEDNISFFRTYYGPTLRAFESLSADKQAALTADMAAVVRKFDRNGSTGGPIAITADYLETVIVRA